YHTIYISTFHTFLEKFLILLGAMDPNGSYPNKVRSSESEAKISPLHDAPRGRAIMPMLSDFVPLNSTPSDSTWVWNTPPTIDAPHVVTMPSIKDCSIMPYQTSVSLSSLPPQLPDAKFTPSTRVNTLPSLPNHREIFENPLEIFSHQDFLSNPIRNYFSSSDQRRIFSMESPSITSLLQGDPIAVVNAHLNTIGAIDDGPIFEIPTRSVYKGPQNIPHGTLTRDASYVVPTPFGPFATSSHDPREDKTPMGVPNGITNSGIVHTTTSSRKYRCSICNLTFNSSQAFGGHMSSHSKARKNKLQS
uniref:C2H2-type domain-containing protein n=4 Tax=Triticinae TaxID=1648030 RepID=A0A453E815_AEGTS